MNGLNSFDKTDLKYLLALTNDLINCSEWYDTSYRIEYRDIEGVSHRIKYRYNSVSNDSIFRTTLLTRVVCRRAIGITNKERAT